MLAGFFHGIVHDRKLMREAQVNLAIRWFAGYRLDEGLPDHSSLTRIRQRWGPERFGRVFEKTVEACIKSGFVTGETVHTDATLIRADVSWESLTTDHAERVLEENECGEEETPKKRGRPRTRPRSPKKYSITDEDATLATSNKRQRLEPSYKQHTTVDDDAGVIVDVELTTGEASEGTRLTELVERVETATGKKVKQVTADIAYAHPANYEAMERRGTEAVIPPMSEPKRSRSIPVRRFKYDALNKMVRCPAGKRMGRSYRAPRGWIYRAKARDCGGCGLRQRCVAPSVKVRTILIVSGYEALIRARRKKPRWGEEWRRLYSRHRWRVEGVHGEAKTQHGLRRAVRRGLKNVAIQVYLTAAVMNLKRLAALLWHFLYCMYRYRRGLGMPGSFYKRLSGRCRENPFGLAPVA